MLPNNNLGHGAGRRVMGRRGIGKLLWLLTRICDKHMRDTKRCVFIAHASLMRNPGPWRGCAWVR